MPRDPQGAETRTEWMPVGVRVEWFAVEDGMYPVGLSDEAEALSYAALPNWAAYRKTTITERIPPHAGEETKG